MITIDSDFEGGCLDRSVRLGENFYHLELRQDTWYYFHFRIRGCKGREIIFQFTCREIREPGYEEGRGRWSYENDTVLVLPVVSYDRKNFSRVEHIEKDRSLKGSYRFRHTFEEDEAYLCFGHPYLYSDLQEYLKTVEEHPYVTRSSVGVSRNGVDQPLLRIAANPECRKTVLILSREDADEITGSFAAEGMLNHLISGAPETEAFLRDYALLFVPMVCVDGVIAGSTHSAGYGYGGNRWHENPAPREIENVKELVRRTVRDGGEIVLAGKLHGGMTMQPVHPVDCISSEAALRDALLANATEYWCPIPREWDLAIRPQGYFERFMLDEFGLNRVFAVHVQGTSAERLRKCGRDLLCTLFNYLNRKG